MTHLRRCLAVLLVLFTVVSLSSTLGYAIISIPGAVPASGCRTGGLMSLDAFTTTGFSQVRTVNAGEEAPAGMWAIQDEAVPAFSVTPTPNCPAPANDGLPLRVVGLRVTPTIGSWQSADIQKIDLVLDNNCNGQYEPGIDFVFQSKSGTELQTTGAIMFVNGPQSPLFTIGPSGGGMFCGVDAVGVMAVVQIGSNPTSGVQFGLSMEALSVDIPGLGPAGFSSGFSSSQNNAGSNIRLQILGGGGGAPPPPPPPPGGGGGGSGLASYDNNGDCVLADSEFFGLLDAWLQSTANDNLFFDGVDAWIGQTNVCVSAAGVDAGTLEGISIAQTLNQISIRAQGADVNSISAEIYSLNGELIYQDQSSGSQLSWNLRKSDGSGVANGVYLYRVNVLNNNGEILSSSVRKLLVLR